MFYTLECDMYLAGMIFQTRSRV
ncbi:DUF6783 domain-containing protein [Dorea sp.]